MDTRSTPGSRIKSRRKEIGLSAERVAELLGVSPATIYRYENGDIDKVPGDRLAPIAKVLNTTPAYLMGWDDSALPAPDVTDDVVTFPILMDVAAGYDQPAQVLQNWEGEKIDVPRAFLHGRPKEDYFAMRVMGHSMYPDYQEGDVLLVLRQDTLDRSGQVGLVLYAGEDATLKKVEYVEGEDWMKLLPVNPQYPPRIINGVDLEQCRILGIPKILVRNIK